jgi:hypothetical protein
MFFVVNFSHAQTTPVISIPDSQVNLGQTLDLDVRVSDFNQIISAAFTVNWDATLLEYAGVTNIALGLSLDDNFNIMGVENGMLTYLFFDSSLSGKTLADGQVLFTIRLNAIGSTDTQTPVVFGGLQEVVDVTEQALVASFMPAIVTIGMPLGVSNDAQLNSAVALDVVPNPFAGDANIQVKLSQAGEATWVMTSINGQQLATGKINGMVGAQQISLPKALFSQSGVYLFKIQQGGVTQMARLICAKG